ncbi:hypothetical protein N7472_003346 [Penicillium cf. griseofulvum]|uniref:Uncharacterized protein n=1 Tax=Penicillium cf. griseofulvum TaxID=2972120 RepID=A0A9W9T2C5_9EURO|nr:hypothetical protein N7472_003346 [Penicillium cf. griseofulvum]
MGRKDFFAKRDELAKERRRLQREKNGYAPRAHKEEDSIREKDKRLPKTNELHRQTMNLWLEFTADPENGYEYYKTSPGSPAPTHEMIKAYIRWYANSIQGRLNDDGLPTVRTRETALHLDNLREYIEGQHLAKIGHCQTKPIYGCSQSFYNERDLRLHLHDAHSLKETIWQNPKLPSKRKRTCKLEAQISSTGLQEGRPKKARFYHYSHLSHEREDYVSEGSSIPVPALLPSVEGNLEQYLGQSICDKYSVSNKSNSVELCFSELVSSPSSGPTTPGLEAIDPRILEPPKFNSDNARQSCDQAAIQPESLISPHEESEATSVSGIKQPQPPALSFASPPSGYCAVTEANEERKDLQEHLTSLPTHDQAVTARFGCDSHPLIREEGKQNRPCDGQVPPSSPRRPLTRAKSQTQSPQHYPGDLNGYKTPKTLNAKNKRKLRDLQRKNLTLRQIGPHFADVDMALLRQAWMELKPSQRCTRSRANWNGN